MLLNANDPLAFIGIAWLVVTHTNIKANAASAVVNLKFLIWRKILRGFEYSALVRLTYLIQLFQSVGQWYQRKFRQSTTKIQFVSMLTAAVLAA
jgi:hypothetical protein